MIKRIECGLNPQSFLFFQKMKILKQFTFFDNYGKMKKQ